VHFHVDFLGKLSAQIIDMHSRASIHMGRKFSCN